MPTKVGKMSIGLRLRELRMGHETCLGNMGSMSIGRNGCLRENTSGVDDRNQMVKWVAKRRERGEWDIVVGRRKERTLE